MKKYRFETEQAKLLFCYFHEVCANRLRGPSFAYASKLNKILAVGNNLCVNIVAAQGDFLAARF